MRKLIFLILASTLSVSFTHIPSIQGEPTNGDYESGSVVCAPDVYLESPGDCLPLGPSVYITEMAKLGLSFPQRALPALKPDPTLTQLPYRYFRLEEDSVPVLSGPAGSETGQAFLPGFVYVSYIDRVESNGVYYLLQNGGWIPGKGFRIVEYSLFRGIAFTSCPHNTFAW